MGSTCRKRLQALRKLLVKLTADSKEIEFFEGM